MGKASPSRTLAKTDFRRLSEQVWEIPPDFRKDMVAGLEPIAVIKG
jgi:hypothetical protein